jgi:hypothetical protein
LAVAVLYLGLDEVLPPNARAVFAETKSLLSNIIASFLLYYLVGYLPAERKRKALRANCKRMYLNTKTQILFDILSGSVRGGRTDIGISSDLIDALMNPVAFRKFFEKGREADEGFYAFSNYIQRNDEAFRSIVFKFKLVARQLEFVLSNIDFEDEKSFQGLKWLEHSLFALDELHADYDTVKSLGQTIWAVFTGWSMVDGYRDFDPIEKAIDEI